MHAMIPRLIADAVHSQPGAILVMPEDRIRRAGNERRVRLSIRQGSVFFKMKSKRFVKFIPCKAVLFRDPVEMDAAEDKIIRPVSRYQVLDEPRIRFI